MATFAQTTTNPVFLELKLKMGVWAGDAEPTTYFGPINITKLELTPVAQDKIRVVSNMHGSIGESLDTQFRATDPAMFTAEFNTFNEDLAAIILGADVADSNQTGAAVADEAVTTILNQWVPLASEMISSTGIVLEDSLSAVIDSSKYEVDIYAGMIKAIHADAVGDMTISYNTSTIVGRSFSAGKAKTTNLRILGYGYDQTSQTYGLLKIHKAIVVSTQALDLAAGAHMGGTLEGDLITPPGYASPWVYTPSTIS